MNTIAGLAFVALRDEVLIQHDRIRHLLGTLNDEAAGVVCAEPKAPGDLGGKLDAVVRALTRHMDFEEQSVSSDPIAAGSWGPAIRARLKGEHERQRDVLARISREAAASDDRISLSFAVRGFVSDVLLDMKLEEARFSSTSAAP
ncbi:MAG: hypothetical protein JWM82_415 [Myxococcales bacterium]|nr:hypothetical protein [Myxococcales bacterium]